MGKNKQIAEIIHKCVVKRLIKGEEASMLCVNVISMNFVAALSDILVWLAKTIS